MKIKKRPRKAKGETGRILTVSNTQFWPVAMVAKTTQLSRPTVWRLASAAQTQNKWPIRSMQMVDNKAFYIAEESVRLLEKRFVHEFNGKPVKENVHLGWKKTGDGYVRTGQAARVLGVSQSTIHEWIKEIPANPRKAAFEIMDLPVIKDPLSNYCYISQRFLLRAAANRSF